MPLQAGACAVLTPGAGTVSKCDPTRRRARIRLTLRCVATPTTSVPESADALRQWLLSGAADAGELRVVDVHVTWDEDSEGEPILRFSVVLEDPDDETWPLDSVLAFHRAVDEHASESELGTAWHVSLEAATEDEPDPADLGPADVAV